MSLTLEQNGVYLLPVQFGTSPYVVLLAERTGDGWALTELHTTPFGEPAFKQRANLPPDQLVSYAVGQDGTLGQQMGPQPAHPPAGGKLTVERLSILGYLRDGAFVPVEGARQPGER